MRAIKMLEFTLVVVITTAAFGAPASLPPVERRANEMFEALRDSDDGAIRRFLEQALSEEFFEMGPMEMHVEHFRGIRDDLGTFEVDDIRIKGPDRGSFVLRSGNGDVFVLNLETQGIDPYRLVGIGLEPYNPSLDIPKYGSLEEATDHLARLEEEGEFSGVLLVSRKGQDDFIRAYGMANKARNIRNTPETRFDVGSITKSLTGLAVMQLVERGKIELDAPMSRYLEGFPPDIADRVSVIDLLRMESGYGDYFGPEFERRREQLTTIPDYMEFFKTLSLKFEPGEKVLYSNVGYVILGGIIERASGMTYHDYVRKQIFERAGMSGSTFRDLSTDDPRSAVGYTNDGPPGEGRYVNTNRSFLDVRGNPSGGSFSPAVDLLRFNRALRANRLLNEANTTFTLNRYEDKAVRPTVRGVAGGAPGVSAVDFEDVDAGVNVIVLSNYDEPLAEEIGEQIFRMLRGESGGSAQATVVPMQIIDHQPAVEVMIQGEGPFLFLMDTGAGDDGSIGRELAERLGLEKVGRVHVGDPSGRNSEMRDLVGVSEVTIGGRTWRDLKMLLSDGPPEDIGIDGILGFAMFEDALLTLDYPNEQMRFEPGELPPADGRDILDFSREHGVPRIDLDIAGTIVPADIDSGSMGWLLVPEKIAERLPLAGEPKVIGKASTSFNEFEIKAAPLAGTLRVGRHELENPSIEMASIFPLANIGGQFLELFSVTFDQANNRVRFARDEEGSVERQPKYRVGMMLMQGPEGLTIDGTVPGSPAERAGLEQGDRVKRVNGTPLDELPPGEFGKVFGKPDEILLVVQRGGSEVELKITPERAN